MLSTLGLQRATPDHIRGRLFGFDYGLVTLTITASTVLAGVLADSLAPAISVWTMVALIAVAGLGWIYFARPVLRDARTPAPAADRPSA